MSSIYNQEPPTSGRVILHTSCGDIDVELWSKQCPKACRNFIQLCLEGYYDGVIFHRIIPDFIAQTGDPTASGVGGESVYGEPFPDEFHSRLRFNRRGLLGMASAGKNDNGSQFFLTLAATEELQGKHTLFGRVVGDSIYHVVQIGEAECDSNDRPILPPRIKDTEVLENPFSDIVPRARPKPIVAEEETSSKEKSKIKKSKMHKRNTKLLSFGEEEEKEEEANLVTSQGARGVKGRPGRIRSSHDLLVDDPQLVRSDQPTSGTSVTDVEKIRMMDGGEKEGTLKGSSGDFREKETTLEASSSKKEDQDLEQAMRESIIAQRAVAEHKDKGEGGRRKRKVDAIQEEIDQVKAKLMGKTEDLSSSSSDSNKPKQKEKYSKASLYHLGVTGKDQIPSTISGSRKSRRAKEDETYAMLEAFTSRMWGAKSNVRPSKKTPSTSEEDQRIRCNLHGIRDCDSCLSSTLTMGPSVSGKEEDASRTSVKNSKEGEEEREEDFHLTDEDKDTSWMAHALCFAKDERGH
ncbi:MAG: cyclophilin-like domain-containing protein [Piptocephalis tieghemiana]|nr:MAG: cyclophilin-like domain-containing protein [Piptocephalis tieghemiana]